MSAQYPNFPQNATSAGFPSETYVVSLEGAQRLEFQTLYAQLQGWMSVDHNGDGTHRNVRALTVEVSGGVLVYGAMFAPGVYAQTTASAANVFVDTNGNLLRQSSSMKYKTDAKTIGLDVAKKLLKLAPITYHSTSKFDDPKREFVGFSAEQVAAIAPEFAVFGAKGQPESVNYAGMVVYLVRLMQEVLK